MIYNQNMLGVELGRPLVDADVKKVATLQVFRREIEERIPPLSDPDLDIAAGELTPKILLEVNEVLSWIRGLPETSPEVSANCIDVLRDKRWHRSTKNIVIPELEFTRGGFGRFPICRHNV